MDYTGTSEEGKHAVAMAAKASLCSHLGWDVLLPDTLYTQSRTAAVAALVSAPQITAEHEAINYACSTARTPCFTHTSVSVNHIETRATLYI